MTQSVTFEFTSPQFDIESGKIIFTKGARFNSTGEFESRDIHHGAVNDVLVEGPIEFDAMLHDLRATRRTDGHSYDVMMFSVSGATTPRDLANARVVVDLDLPVIITLRVEDSSGAPIPGAIVNIATPSFEGTWEGPVNERGEIVLFGEVGSYFVMLASVGRRWLGRAKVIAHFEVTPHDLGERVVVLRVPNP